MKEKRGLEGGGGTKKLNGFRQRTVETCKKNNVTYNSFPIESDAKNIIRNNSVNGAIN